MAFLGLQEGSRRQDDKVAVWERNLDVDGQKSSAGELGVTSQKMGSWKSEPNFRCGYGRCLGQMRI